MINVGDWVEYRTGQRKMPSDMDLGAYPINTSVPSGFPWNLRLVVSGLPRGGTQFTRSVLRDLLQDRATVGHEGVFCYNFIRDYGTRPCHDVDVTGFAWPYGELLQEHGIPVVHLVRHPVTSVNSMLNFFRKAFPEKERDWTEAVEMWCGRHANIAARATCWYRLEDQMDKLCETASQILGLDFDPLMAENAIIKSPKGNSTRGDTISWDFLPPMVQDFAVGFGYDEGSHGSL